MRIVYGVAGEGLGHATRAHAMIEELGEDCHFDIFTFGEAWKYFQGVIRGGAQNIYLHDLFGLRFGRGRSNKISLTGTVREFFNYKRKYSDLDRHSVYWTVLSAKPDVVITDFEPATAAGVRMVRLNRPPLVSVDNQHKFSHFSTDELPWKLRVYCNLTGWFTGRYIGKTDGCVVSTFYHELGRASSNVTKTSVFIRKAVRDLESTDQGHVLVYWKKSVGPEMLYNLQRCPYPVKVYGPDVIPGCRPFLPTWIESKEGWYPGPAEFYDNFSFHPLDYTNFVKDLASCKALFCASGNQLLGEACYFNKPTFTVPEPNQDEQTVNAFYAEKMGFARRAVARKYGCETVMDFLHNFKAKKQKRVNGVTEAAEVIRSFAKRRGFRGNSVLQ